MNKKTGIELIAEERKEQIEKHGWTKGHDQQHDKGELAKMAAILAVLHTDAEVSDPNGFESGENIWGLEGKLVHDTIHALKVAGAFLAAEIDRIQNRTK